MYKHFRKISKIRNNLEKEKNATKEGRSNITTYSAFVYNRNEINQPCYIYFATFMKNQYIMRCFISDTLCCATI